MSRAKTFPPKQNILCPRGARGRRWFSDREAYLKRLNPTAPVIAAAPSQEEIDARIKELDAVLRPSRWRRFRAWFSRKFGKGDK